jgi:RNA polymerase sigma factor (sigma-70 family)
LSQEIMDTFHYENPDLAALLEALMLRHGSKWLRFVQRMVQNHADAEDVLQEAALKMLLRDRHFQTPDQARMYLGRIISNTAIEQYHLRRRQRRQQSPLAEHRLPAIDLPVAPVLLAEGEEERSRAQLLDLVREGLARLPVKQYEAVCMTVMDPATASMRDAGIEHHIPYSTLRHRKLQGLRRLRRFLQRALRSVPTYLVLA